MDTETTVRRGRRWAGAFAAAGAVGSLLFAGVPAAARVQPGQVPVTGPSVRQGDPDGFWTEERMRAAKPMETYLPGSGGGTLPPAGGKPWPGSPQAVRTTGRLFMTLSGDRLASCTAAVVDSPSREVIATAAHCVRLKETGGWAERVLFVPGYRDGQRPYGAFSAQRAVVSAAWSENEDPDQDYAFVRLAASSRGRVADVVGSEALSFTRHPFRRTVTLGYPAAAPYDGRTVQYCSGTARPSPRPDSAAQQYLKPCYFTEGSSGGPWYAAFDPESGRGVQTGVTSSKPAGADGDAYLFGAMFDPVAEKLYREADSG